MGRAVPARGRGLSCARRGTMDWARPRAPRAARKPGGSERDMKMAVKTYELEGETWMPDPENPENILVRYRFESFGFGLHKDPIIHMNRLECWVRHVTKTSGPDAPYAMLDCWNSEKDGTTREIDRLWFLESLASDKSVYPTECGVLMLSIWDADGPTSSFGGHFFAPWVVKDNQSHIAGWYPEKGLRNFESFAELLLPLIRNTWNENLELKDIVLVNKDIASGII